MNKLDELFKDKLAEHTIAPSANSWEKVESALTKKNSGVIWFRWAAVFLLGILAVSFFLIKKEDNKRMLAEEQTNKPAKQSTQRDSIAEKITPLQDQNQTTIAKTTVKRSRKNSQPVVERAIEEEKKNNEVAQATTEEKVASTVQEPTMIVASVNEQKTEKSIVLTYTLDPVESPAETITAVAASDERKENSLKKVMKFAKEVKNGESSFPGLRVVKEDLFALDLKKKTTSKNH